MNEETLSTREIEERAYYDAVSLIDCQANKCPSIEERRELDGDSTVICTVSSVQQCPAVIDHFNPKLPENAGPTTEYEVWCREISEDTATVAAESLDEANKIATQMVELGQLYPSPSDNVTFGARELDTAEISMTLVCEHKGCISILHATGPVFNAVRDLNKSGYEVLAVFAGEHSDILET